MIMQIWFLKNHEWILYRNIVVVDYGYPPMRQEAIDLVKTISPITRTKDIVQIKIYIHGDTFYFKKNPHMMSLGIQEFIIIK